MACIEIKTKGLNAKAQINSEEHSVTFLISLKRMDGNDQVSIHLSGYNKSSKEDLKWFDENIQIGSEININLLRDQDSTTEPSSVIQQLDSFVDDQKLKTYNFLKKELLEKGLI